jgi:hypothetical protein
VSAAKTKTIQDIVDEVTKIKALYSTRDGNATAYHDMYFMNDSQTLSDHDANDVKETISPSARNAVAGVHRLLKTSEPQFKATSQTGNSDQIGNACKAIYKASCKLLPTSVHSDACLGAPLFGMVTMKIEAVDDLLKLGLNGAIQARLQDIRLQTPFLITSIPANQSYPLFGKFGLRAHVHSYLTTVGDVRENFGDIALPDRDDEAEIITLNEYYDAVYYGAYVEGENVPVTPKAFGAHGLKRIPIVCTLAGGSSLFSKPEEQIMPFLFAMNTGGWWKRENQTFTTLFTSMFERGTGPLFAVDPTSLDGGQEVVVNWSGVFRYILAKVQPINDKAFDENLLNVKGLLDAVAGESMIFQQTLGQNLTGTNSFSSLAMLSQSGKLPLVDYQEAVSKALEEVFVIGLRRMKDEGIKYTVSKNITPVLNPQDIPDDLVLECTLEPNLPQDQMKNAQVAMNLGDAVSTEWKRTNLLQVNDNDEMTEQIWTEKAAQTIFAQLIQSPQFIQQFMQMIAGLQNPQGGATQPGGTAQPGALPQANLPAQQPPEQPMPPANSEQPTIQGGPQAAMAGMPANPATEPQMPGQPGGMNGG